MRLLTLACCLSLSSWAVAQDISNLSEYQQGAGAYFAGRTDQAEEHLSAALESDPNDIRAYYLRGLNRLNTGDLRGAQADLAKGAELEAQRGSASPLVDQSLSSVQGSARVTLERIRREARRSAELEQRRATTEARKQHREQQEKRVLRTDYQLPIEALASRLTVEQARQVATKLGPEDQGSVATAVATNQQPMVDENDPFVDDTPAVDANPFGAVDPEPAPAVVATASEEQGDVPAAARGTVDAGRLFGVVTNAVGQVFTDRASVITDVLPMDSLSPPPGMMGGFNPSGEASFPAGEGFPAGGEEMPAFGEGAEVEGAGMFGDPETESPAIDENLSQFGE
ncbi:hypothetical protein [Aeoliella sp.]|uniref:hypothetical protein n=1 Tax=Aeoliella sp. TaxID=2795800 RepID=UPI003CCC0B45